MTDRFKFRVWDNLDEKYYEDNCFQIQIESSGDLFIIGPGNDGEDCLWETDNVIIEQCTGLKDKNGRLIYDGDYIRAINQDTKDKPDLQFGHIWVDELNCRWVKFDKEELSWNDFCSLIDYDLTLEIEVIGNEHQGLGIKEIVDE